MRSAVMGVDFPSWYNLQLLRSFETDQPSWGVGRVLCWHAAVTELYLENSRNVSNRAL